MAIEIKNNELDQLIALLSKKRHSVITQAQCTAQLLSNPTHQVFVDNIEDPLFALFSPNQQYLHECGYVSRYHLHSDDNGMGSPDVDVKLAEFLDSCNLNDPSKHNVFSAVNVPVFHALSRYFAGREIKVKQRPDCNVFVFDNQAKNELSVLDENFALGSIRSEEVEEVIRCTRTKKTTEFSKESEYVTHSIANYPSVCIRDKEQGDRLACFIIASSCGLQTNLFTYPEYRNKGLARVVTVAHANLLQPIFGAAISTVGQRNTASQNMFGKLNYKMQSDHHVLWLETHEFA